MISIYNFTFTNNMIQYIVFFYFFLNIQYIVYIVIYGLCVCFVVYNVQYMDSYKLFRYKNHYVRLDWYIVCDMIFAIYALFVLFLIYGILYIVYSIFLDKRRELAINFVDSVALVYYHDNDRCQSGGH